MTESAVEKVARVAHAESQSSLEAILKLAAVTDNDGDEVEPGSEAAEANDNDEMMHMGVHMNATGHATYGSVALGRVHAHKSGKGYVGIHPSGLVTGKHPTRAKAAMALLNLHQYVPKDSKKQIKHLTLSNSALGTVIALAGDVPGNGKKPYGNVTYADPKNAGMYPLNGVSLSEVKAKIKAACSKFGIDISDNSK